MGELKRSAHLKIRNLQWVQRYDTGVIFCLEAHAFRCALRSVQGGVFWASAPKGLRFVNRGYWGGLKTSAHSKIRNLQWVQRYDTGVIFCLEAHAFRCALRSVQGGVFGASAPKGLKFVNRGYRGGLKTSAHSKIRNLQWVQRYDNGVIFCLEAHAFRCA